MAKRAIKDVLSGHKGFSPRRARKGDIFPDNHPLVGYHPDSFEDVDSYLGRTFSDFVETATAEPGLKRRGPGRPPKVRTAEPEPETKPVESSAEESESEE